MDDDEVPAVLEEQRIVEDALEVDALHLGRPVDVGALQRVVDLLGDGEELVASVQHLPLGLDPDAAEQRHVRRQQLGDTAAVGGGADVEHARPAERLGRLTDLGHGVSASDVGIEVEFFLEKRDPLEHSEQSSDHAGRGRVS